MRGRIAAMLGVVLIGALGVGAGCSEESADAPATAATTQTQAPEVVEPEADGPSDAQITAGWRFFEATDDDAIRLDGLIADAQDGVVGAAGKLRAMQARLQKRLDAYTSRWGVGSPGAQELIDAARKAAAGAQAGDLPAMAQARRAVAEARHTLAASIGEE